METGRVLKRRAMGVKGEVEVDKVRMVGWEEVKGLGWGREEGEESKGREEDEEGEGEGIKKEDREGEKRLEVSR